MIVNVRHEDSIVRKMEEFPGKFYLTGSRFFGGVHSKSDWDYFTNDTYKTRAFLQLLGFVEDQKSAELQYDDFSLNTVFVLNDIHIQLVKDAFVKNKAQTFLLENVPMKSIPKASRKYVWNLALRIVIHNLLVPG